MDVALRLIFLIRCDLRIPSYCRGAERPSTMKVIVSLTECFNAICVLIDIGQGRVSCIAIQHWNTSMPTFNE